MYPFGTEGMFLDRLLRYVLPRSWNMNKKYIDIKDLHQLQGQIGTQRRYLQIDNGIRGKVTHLYFHLRHRPRFSDIKRMRYRYKRQSNAIEKPVVRITNQIVRLHCCCLIHIKGIHIFHQELSSSQQSCSWPFFVPKLSSYSYFPVGAGDKLI